jgi:hypothetical protein
LGLNEIEIKREGEGREEQAREHEIDQGAREQVRDERASE